MHAAEIFNATFFIVIGSIAIITIVWFAIHALLFIRFMRKVLFMLPGYDEYSPGLAGQVRYCFELGLSAEYCASEFLRLQIKKKQSNSHRCVR